MDLNELLGKTNASTENAQVKQTVAKVAPTPEHIQTGNENGLGNVAVPGNAPVDAFSGLREALSQSPHAHASVHSVADSTQQQQQQANKTGGVFQHTEPDPTDMAALGKFQFSTQPEQATEETSVQFKRVLTQLAEAINDPASIADNIRTTLKFLNDNPNMKEILMPEDIQLMVRACRKSYGGAIVEKNKRSSKRKATDQAADELVSMLGSNFFNV